MRRSQYEGKHVRQPGKFARRSLKSRIAGLVAIPAAGAMAITPVLVQNGDTLWGISQSHGVSLGALERANPQIHNPDLIFTGQRVNLPGVSAPVQHHQHHAAPAGKAASPGSSSSGSSGGSSGLASSDLADIPGVPRDFAACVAFRESSNGTNQAFNGGVYGIIRASGVNVNGQPLAVQKAAFSKLFAQFGKAPWSPFDGCP